MEKNLHGCRFRNSSLKNLFSFKLRYDIDEDYQFFLWEQKLPVKSPKPKTKFKDSCLLHSARLKPKSAIVVEMQFIYGYLQRVVHQIYR